MGVETFKWDHTYSVSNGWMTGQLVNEKLQYLSHTTGQPFDLKISEPAINESNSVALLASAATLSLITFILN